MLVGQKLTVFHYSLRDFYFLVGFVRAGLNYSEFSVVADARSFRSTEGIEAIVKDLSSR